MNIGNLFIEAGYTSFFQNLIFINGHLYINIGKKFLDGQFLTFYAVFMVLWTEDGFKLKF